jgi:phospholipid/cholesterol/gamma-HCH transport system permease protein
MQNIILDTLLGVFHIFRRSSRLVGRIFIFILYVILAIIRGKICCKSLLKHMIDIGYYSLSVIGMTAIFTGAALAMQSYSGFSRFNIESSMPIIVALSMTRELGPVLCGLMIAGRVGSGIASEVAMMKSTEQIDALYTMNTDPIEYLVAPRVFAGFLVMPILVLISDAIGIMGGYFVSVYKLEMSSFSYMRKTVEILRLSDVASGLIKASVFGFIICVIACFNGMTAKSGAVGVGRSVTSTVMMCSVLVLLCNYIITSLMFVA